MISKVSSPPPSHRIRYLGEKGESEVHLHQLQCAHLNLDAVQILADIRLRENICLLSLIVKL